MKRLLIILSLALIFFISGCAASQSDTPYTNTLAGPLDTVSSITIYGANKEQVANEVFDAIRNIDLRMSAVSSDSEIALISKNSGTPVTVSPDTFALIEKSLEISASTNGAFDPTIRPIVDLWGIGNGNERIPSEDEINATLSSVDYKCVELNAADYTVRLVSPNMSLDLGGIAKGYACDVAVEILRKHDVKRAILDFGGNIYAFGSKSEDTDWSVGVKTPLAEKNVSDIFGTLRVNDKAVVTSGVYERYFENDGKLYHHIFNPVTGYPVNDGLLSVTIIAKSATDADVLSTACFVLGVEQGMKLLAEYEDAAGIFVTDDLSVYLTDGFDNGLSFSLTENRFKVVPNS